MNQAENGLLAGKEAMTTSAESSDSYAQLDNALDRIRTGGAHYRVFMLVAAGSLFNVIEQYNAGYASTVLRAHWDLSATAVSALSTATFLSMAVGAMLTGVLADKFGRRLLFMINVGLYTAGSLVAALAPDYAVLLLARIIIGLGLGGEIGLGYTVIAEVMKAKVRGVMTAGLAFVSAGIGVFAASGLAALILGPLAGPLGGEGTAWRWLFGVMVVPALLIFVFRRYIPETPRYLLRRGEVAEVNRILSNFAIGKLHDTGTAHLQTWITAPEGVPARPGEEKTDVRELFAPLLRRRTLVAWALTVAMFGSFSTFAIFTPALFEARGLSVGLSLLFATIANFAGLIGAGVGTIAAQFLPRRLVFVVGGAVLAITIGALALVSTAAGTLALAAVMQFVFQFVIPTSWCYLPELFPTRVRATGAGSASTVGLLASGFGPLAAGALLDTSGLAAVFALLIGLTLVFCIAAPFGPETKGSALIEVTADGAEGRSAIGVEGSERSSNPVPET